jgi:hypothetical protein
MSKKWIYDLINYLAPDGILLSPNYIQHSYYTKENKHIFALNEAQIYRTFGVWIDDVMYKDKFVPAPKSWFDNSDVNIDTDDIRWTYWMD